MALHVLASFLSSLWRGTCDTESLRTNTQCIFYLSDQWKLWVTSMTAGQVSELNGGWRRAHMDTPPPGLKIQGLLTLSPSPCCRRVNIINWNPNLNLTGQKNLIHERLFDHFVIEHVRHWLCLTWQRAGVAAIRSEGLSPAPVWSWHDLVLCVSFLWLPWFPPTPKFIHVRY